VPRDFDETNVNRRYFRWYVDSLNMPGARVLDFGCGSGRVVRLLRNAGYDAYGVDIRWPGADFYGDIEATELAPGVLRYFEPGQPLPFPDDHFDVIVSDQVIEHVPELEATAAELDRILRPGGVCYHHFPSKMTLREGHIGIPLAHLLPRGRARLLYTAALRAVGLGANKDDRPPMRWAAENLAWIDEFTVYRPPGAVESILARHGVVRHRELDYCRFRAADRPLLRRLLNQSWSRRPAASAFRRLGFEAIEVRGPVRADPAAQAD
jgi:SAM-dependent methyltransferase